MSPAEPFRAFFALPLEPGEAAALCREAAAEIAASGERGWRPVPRERIHLTLKFLGDAPPDRVEELSCALREGAALGGPVEAAFEAWVRLPGSRDPRVLAARLSDPAGRLAALAAHLEDRAAALGFPREGRPFLAHVTVARRRNPGRGVPPPASGRGKRGQPEGPGRFLLSRLVLMKSTLGPDGPAYEVVEEAALGGPTREAPPAR